MSKVINLKKSGEKNTELVINPDMAAEIGIEDCKNAYISFGCLKHYVDIRKDSSVETGDILLPEKLMYDIHIPDYPLYEISVTGNEIKIGPCIGLLLSKDDGNITQAFLNKMKVYIRDYSRLHGAIIVFALNKVDTKNLVIEGYCYNPVLNNFQKGIFPYPSAIYRTVGLGDIWKNHFLSVIGDKLFNSHYFNKKQMHNWLSEESEIKYSIPATKYYDDYSDISSMLERFGEVYIKPVSGLGGRGIIKISVIEDSWIIKYRDKGRNIEDRKDDEEECRKIISKLLEQGRYIVQQGIKLLKYNDGLVDFRCIMQKNQRNEWVCNAIIGRNGERDSIVSNISSGGRAYNAFYLLKRALQLPENDVRSVIGRIEALAVTVCARFDRFGLNLGTLGLDIGIDEDGKLWLIEVNNRDPDPTIALDVNDMQLYYNLKTSPLYYAKYLAGFFEA